MKRSFMLLSILLLSACTMNAKNIETTCYSQKSFQDLSNCIYEEVAKTDAKSRNAPLYEKYVAGAKLLESEVEKKNISDEQARLLLSMLRTNLEEEDRQQLSEELGKLRNLGRVNGGGNNGSITDNKVYREDECIGAVVMGKCHGSIIDKGGYHKTCHGEWINGMCTGAMF